MSENTHDVDDVRGPKERLYDEAIAPLMAQIIATCKEHGLPMFATFALDGDLLCTTFIADPTPTIPAADREGYDKWRAACETAYRTIRPPRFVAYTLTTREARA